MKCNTVNPVLLKQSLFGWLNVKEQMQFCIQMMVFCPVDYNMITHPVSDK